ncbi:DUF4038 domain-containing protein [Acidobacterium sp. S8]|uniref:apiosidase-like domain-containing protein n=1 Tax=Acidobacterium sp. S8 TaxID=1641854 RepID=UPI00131BAADC|nr:DUF4038 domain-containing protein [Acidobacterium sp. S8]
MVAFRRVRWCVLLVSTLFIIGCSKPGPLNISFTQSSLTVEAYDFVEVTANVSRPRAANPFTDASLHGWFEAADGSRRWNVEGFCDSENGSLFRIRFMPPKAGTYRYFIEYRQGRTHRESTGTFTAVDGHRRGPIRVDSKYPWHFQWEGTGEHYFFNGTTAYWLMGWQDDNVIQAAIERLHKLKINRIRVTIAGRAFTLYGEPAMTGPAWTLCITPWPAKNAEDIYQPGFDYTRFDVSYWQRFERALRYARERDMIVSLVLDMNDGVVHPKAGSDDERRFIQYAVNRFGAYSNITWDLGDDLDRYRNVWWTHRTGMLINEWDPYKHLATSHPIKNTHQDRTSDWFSFTSFQEWSRDQHAFMLGEREQQEKLGRIIPQTNEEYGYEDHYPLWGPPPPEENADTLRRTAWDIAMAGGYGTTGETAKRGTNIWPDTGGGWLNGRGDDTMTMLKGYGYMVDFFTSFEWWKTNPHDELVNSGNYCLADAGNTYAVYLPKGGRAHIKLQSGKYTVRWFDAQTGEWSPEQEIQTGSMWDSPSSPDAGDWALLLRRLSSGH